MTAHIVVSFSNIGKHSAPPVNLNVESIQEAVDDIVLYVEQFDGCSETTVQYNAETGRGNLDEGRSGVFTLDVRKVYDPYEEANKRAAEEAAA